jgi:hypothetical protein
MHIVNVICAVLALFAALATFAAEGMARPPSAAARGLEISTQSCLWRSIEKSDGTRIQQTRECPDSDLRVRHYQYPDGTTGTKIRTRTIRFQDVRRHSGRRDLYLRFRGERGSGTVSIRGSDSRRILGAEHLPNLALDGRLISGRAGDTVLLFSDGVATARLVGNQSTSVPPSSLAADSSGDLRLESEPLLQASLGSGLGSEGLLFGDSILQLVTGWGASDGLPKPNAFLDLWTALSNGDDVLNLAINGDSTQGNLYRARWTPASLRWAVVHVGTNNLAGGVAPQEVAEGSGLHRRAHPGQRRLRCHRRDVRLATCGHLGGQSPHGGRHRGFGRRHHRHCGNPLDRSVGGLGPGHRELGSLLRWVAPGPHRRRALFRRGSRCRPRGFSGRRRQGVRRRFRARIQQSLRGESLAKTLG